MVRNNYTKVEEALKEGIQQMEIEKLYRELEKKEGTVFDERKKEIIQKSLAVKVALKWALKQDKEVYQKIGIDQQIIKELLEKKALTDSDLVVLDKMLMKLDHFKKDCEKSQGITSDKELVERQRKKQITKRFNVNSKWLPLK